MNICEKIALPTHYQYLIYHWISHQCYKKYHTYNYFSKNYHVEFKNVYKKKMSRVIKTVDKFTIVKLIYSNNQMRSICKYTNTDTWKAIRHFLKIKST